MLLWSDLDHLLTSHEPDDDAIPVIHDTPPHSRLRHVRAGAHFGRTAEQSIALVLVSARGTSPRAARDPGGVLVLTDLDGRNSSSAILLED